MHDARKFVDFDQTPRLNRQLLLIQHLADQVTGRVDADSRQFEADRVLRRGALRDLVLGDVVGTHVRIDVEGVLVVIHVLPLPDHLGRVGDVPWNALEGERFADKGDNLGDTILILGDPFRATRRIFLLDRDGGRHHTAGWKTRERSTEGLPTVLMKVETTHTHRERSYGR